MTITKRVLRFEVPVDDQWHDLDLPGAIRHLASRRHGVVELWVETTGPVGPRRLRVFATGQQVPSWCSYLGTTLDGPLVWHLFEEHR